MTTQYGFFIDSSRCTGCKTVSVKPLPPVAITND